MRHFPGGVTACHGPGTALGSGGCTRAHIRHALWEGAGRFGSWELDSKSWIRAVGMCALGASCRGVLGAQRNIQLRRGIIGSFPGASQMVSSLTLGVPSGPLGIHANN